MYSDNGILVCDIECKTIKISAVYIKSTFLLIKFYQTYVFLLVAAIACSVFLSIFWGVYFFYFLFPILSFLVLVLDIYYPCEFIIT